MLEYRRWHAPRFRDRSERRRRRARLMLALGFGRCITAPRQRAALRLWAGSDTRWPAMAWEIASAMGCTEHAVWRLVERARKRLGVT